MRACRSRLLPQKVRQSLALVRYSLESNTKRSEREWATHNASHHLVPIGPGVMTYSEFVTLLLISRINDILVERLAVLFFKILVFVPTTVFVPSGLFNGFNAFNAE
jgi:hypothetical protein